MSELITMQFRHLLWQDECGDDFLILKHCEVYRKSEDILKLVVFNPKIFNQNAFQLRNQGVILNEWSTDDGLLLLDVNTQNLALVIALGTFKRRPHKDGAWIKDKEERLAHKILPYNPRLKKVIGEGPLGVLNPLALVEGK